AVSRVKGVEIENFAVICLRQPPAAGIEQQQDRARPALAGLVARGAQQADKFCPVHLAEGPAEKTSLLRGDEHRPARKFPTADDDAVVKGSREVELREVRAHGALLRADELAKTSGIENPRNPLARRRLVEVQLVRLQKVAHSPPSISRAPCIRRRVTTSGRAPPSLIEKRRPPGAQRSKKSSMTACQRSRNPVIVVATSTTHSLP